VPPPRKRKRKTKNERYIDFTFGPGGVGFCAGLAIAAYGSLHLSAAGLSGG
jgi:hypothetical protein